jgi:hypothetical protein
VAAKKILNDFPAHTARPFHRYLAGSRRRDVRRLSLDKMRRVMEIAASLRSRLMVIISTMIPVTASNSRSGWSAAPAFRSCCRARRPLIALENISEATPHIVLQLLAQPGQPRLVHCFDFGHHRVRPHPVPGMAFYLNPRDHIHFHLRQPRRLRRSFGHGAGRHRLAGSKKAISGLACPFSIALEPKSQDVLRASAAFYRKNFLAGETRGADASRAGHPPARSLCLHPRRPRSCPFPKRRRGRPGRARAADDD